MIAAVFLEAYARPLLVVHLVVAAALVATTTHHLIWAVRYLWGNYQRRRGERTLALVACCLYVAAFALGNLLYPTYKIRVREGFFDDPGTVAAVATAREAADARIEAGERGQVAEPRAARAPISLGWLGKLFDVKEHLVAIGLALSIALCLFSRKIELSERRELAPAFVGLSAMVCVLVWLGALIGAWVATVQPVGAI